MSVLSGWWNIIIQKYSTWILTHEHTLFGRFTQIRAHSSHPQNRWHIFFIDWGGMWSQFWETLILTHTPTYHGKTMLLGSTSWFFRKESRFWIRKVAPDVNIWAIIWQCVKTNSTPGEHQNSWDLWMFIPLKMVLIGIDPYPYLPMIFPKKKQHLRPFQSSHGKSYPSPKKSCPVGHPGLTMCCKVLMALHIVGMSCRTATMM